jgi:hypothetical protein
MSAATKPYEGTDGKVIQIPRKERGDWIAWNWDMKRWDVLPDRIADGEQADAQAGKDK